MYFILFYFILKFILLASAFEENNKVDHID